MIYNAFLDQCMANPCPASSSLNIITDTCTAPPGEFLGCPAGHWDAGLTCNLDPKKTCPSDGTIDSADGPICYTDDDANLCSGSYIFDPFTFRCERGADVQSVVVTCPANGRENFKSSTDGCFYPLPPSFWTTCQSHYGDLRIVTLGSSCWAATSSVVTTYECSDDKNLVGSVCWTSPEGCSFAYVWDPFSNRCEAWPGETCPDDYTWFPGIACTIREQRDCPEGLSDNGFECEGPRRIDKCPSGSKQTLTFFDSWQCLKDSNPSCCSAEQLGKYCSVPTEVTCPDGLEFNFAHQICEKRPDNISPISFRIDMPPTIIPSPDITTESSDTTTVVDIGTPTLPDDGVKEQELSIPDWIKNTAGWWAEKSVDDSDFTGGISFLIEEDIISIPDLPPPSESMEENVPDWIRNMAGWWADDLTTDQEFADAIKFLVEKGIIQVKT